MLTYDLRWLPAHGQQALLFTHAHDHLLRTALAQITDPDPPKPS